MLYIEPILNNAFVAVIVVGVKCFASVVWVLIWADLINPRLRVNVVNISVCVYMMVIDGENVEDDGQC